MKIAFVGLPLAALLLAGDGHEIVWAGICRRGALGTRRLTRRIGKDNVAIVPDLTKVAATIRAREPDLVVSWFWTKKVPRAMREAAKFGAIGVHPSLLPRHRGPDPYFWALDSGDEETGVSAHVLEDDYDTGAILGTRSITIEPSWNAWKLAKRLDRPSLALLRETVAAFARGSPPAAVAQDERRATTAPEPEEDQLELRWRSEAAAIVRRVRAASPWPGCFTWIGDTVVTLTRVQATTDFPRALEVGEAFVRANGIAVVRAADTAVELLEGRIEGEDEERVLREEDLAALVGANSGERQDRGGS